MNRTRLLSQISLAHRMDPTPPSTALESLCGFLSIGTCQGAEPLAKFSSTSSRKATTRGRLSSRRLIGPLRLSASRHHARNGHRCRARRHEASRQIEKWRTLFRKLGRARRAGHGRVLTARAASSSAAKVPAARLPSKREQRWQKTTGRHENSDMWSLASSLRS